MLGMTPSCTYGEFRKHKKILHPDEMPGWRIFSFQNCVNDSAFGSDNSAGCNRCHPVQAAVADAGLAVRRMDNGAAADIDCNVVDLSAGAAEEYQVARRQAVNGNLCAAGQLGCSVMRKRNAEVCED